MVSVFVYHGPHRMCISKLSTLSSIVVDTANVKKSSNSHKIKITVPITQVHFIVVLSIIFMDFTVLKYIPTLRLAPCPDVFMYNTQIPSALNIKYLGLTLDRRLTWAQHIKPKSLNLYLRLRILISLVNHNKCTHIDTKLLHL